MIEYCIKKIKQNPHFFYRLKNNTFLMKGISRFLLLRFIIQRSNLTLSLMFIYNSFCYYVLRIKKDITVTIRGTNIIMPNHMKAIDGAIEVMYDKFYDNLQGFNCVLDIGGYIGESAIRLAQMNNHVVVYEAHPDNYTYLLQNTQSYPNISSHNKAVVGTDQSSMTFYGGAFDMGAGRESTGNKKSSKVSCINIIDVLQSHHFDAMKMDIEGSEYECMETIMKEGGELFQKLKAGFIEFHFHNNPKKAQKAKKIIQRIIGLGYGIECFDAVSSQKIDMINIENFGIIFIYFKN